MNAREVGIVAITVLGIWFALESLSVLFVMAPAILGGEPEFFEMWASLIPSVVFGALAAIGLIAPRERLARAFFPAASPMTVADSKELQAPLLSVAGIIFAAIGLVQLIHTEAAHLHAR